MDMVIFGVQPAPSVNEIGPVSTANSGLLAGRQIALTVVPLTTNRQEPGLQWDVGP